MTDKPKFLTLGFAQRLQINTLLEEHCERVDDGLCQYKGEMTDHTLVELLPFDANHRNVSSIRKEMFGTLIKSSPKGPNDQLTPRINVLGEDLDATKLLLKSVVEKARKLRDEVKAITTKRKGRQNRANIKARALLSRGSIRLAAFKRDMADGGFTQDEMSEALSTICVRSFEGAKGSELILRDLS